MEVTRIYKSSQAGLYLIQIASLLMLVPTFGRLMIT
jgi:hypothetical protein